MDITNRIGHEREPATCKHCRQSTAKDTQFCCSGCESAYLGMQILSKDEKRGLEEGKAYSFVPSNQEELQISSINNLAKEVTYNISGIHCARCVNLLEALPKREQGILEARVNLTQGTIKLDFLPQKISLTKLKESIESLGYTLSLDNPNTLSQVRKSNKALYRLGVAAFCAMNTMMLAVSLFQALSTGMESEYGELFRWASLVLTLPVVTFCAWPFYQNALSGLKSRVIHIDLPLAIAIVAAFGLSCWNTFRSDQYVYFDSVCALVFLLLCGRFIQGRALDKAREDTKLSWSLLPNKARVFKNDDEEHQVDVSKLSLHDTVVVYPLERLPVDGEVIRGVSSIDSSVLTGESMPEIVGIGSKVAAGALNIEGTIEVSVSGTGAETRIGRILKSLESAARPKWGIESFIDRTSAWFTGIVLVMCLLGALFWANQGLEKSLEVAVTFLIVTCPCALGIATPLAVGMVVGGASRKGIFIKSPDVLERIQQAERVFLDKTGTVTEGKLQVIDSWYAKHVNRNEILSLLAIESIHPIAQAISKFAKAEIKNPDITIQVRQIPSRGVELYEGTNVIGRLGSASWMTELGFQLLQPTLTKRWSESGSSITYFANQNEIVAIFCLKDFIKPGMDFFISNLVSRGVAPFLLSGDNQQTVKSIAARLGIDGIGELLAEDKACKLRQHRNTCFIGDGVNDTLAMKAAGVSIGMTGGMKATMEVADIFVSSGLVEDLQSVFDAADRMFVIIRRNLVFSVFYNLIGGGLALAGFMNPFIAALLMPASSITVIAHTMLNQPFKRYEL
jgi:Cu2+-exporting ATPase